MKSSSFNQLLFLVATVLCFAVSSCKNEPAATATDATEPAPVPPTSKGVLSITTSADLTTATYDKLSAAATADGQWMKDWSYHAIGTMQPKGIFSFGVYPSQAGLDNRRAYYKDLFPKLGINAPAPMVHEIHNVIMGAQPAQKPASGFVAAFFQKGMTAEIYAAVLKELEAAGIGAPAGRMYHVSFLTGDGVQVIDVWESDALFKAFGDKLMPILQAKGVTATPAIHPLYHSMAVN